MLHFVTCADLFSFIDTGTRNDHQHINKIVITALCLSVVCVSSYSRGLKGIRSVVSLYSVPMSKASSTGALRINLSSFRSPEMSWRHRATKQIATSHTTALYQASEEHTKMVCVCVCVCVCGMGTHYLQIEGSDLFIYELLDC